MNSYNALIKEATHIEWDKSQINRFGQDYSNDENFWAIRASRYNQRMKENNYGDKITILRNNALNEITLLTDEQIRQCIKRLTLISQDYFDNLFPTFTEWLGKWDSGQFKAFDFELKFFPLFNMKAARVVCADSPDFNGLTTTSDFFSDLSDALMYKNGAILHLLYDLSVFVGDKVEIFVLQHMKEKEIHEKWFAKSESYRKSVTDSENLPEPKSPSEEWEQFVKYFAQTKFELLRLEFYQLHGDAITERVLREELEEIENFIQDAERIKTKVAYSREGKTRFPHMMHEEDWKEEYVRLSRGYYTSDRSGNSTSLDGIPLRRRIDFAINGLPRQVYGKYFLYKDWLEKEIGQRKTSKPKKVAPDKKNRDTTKARRAITRLKTMVDEECKIHSGRKSKLDEKTIIQSVLFKWSDEGDRLGFGTTEKTIKRYLADIGIQETVKKYIGQRVGQYIRDNKL